MIVALINDFVVQGVSIIADADYPALAQRYQAVIDVGSMSPQPAIGWIFTGSAIVPPSGVYVPSLKITKLGFRNRFTFSEKVAMQTAMPVSVVLQAWYQDFLVATYVDLARSDTIGGIYYLESAGLIASGRAAQIVSAPITDIEAFK